MTKRDSTPAAGDARDQNVSDDATQNAAQTHGAAGDPATAETQRPSEVQSITETPNTPDAQSEALAPPVLEPIIPAAETTPPIASGTPVNAPGTPMFGTAPLTGTGTQPVAAAASTTPTNDVGRKQRMTPAQKRLTAIAAGSILASGLLFGGGFFAGSSFATQNSHSVGYGQFGMPPGSGQQFEQRGSGGGFGQQGPMPGGQLPGQLPGQDDSGETTVPDSGSTESGTTAPDAS